MEEQVPDQPARTGSVRDGVRQIGNQTVVAQRPVHGALLVGFLMNDSMFALENSFGNDGRHKAWKQ
jgi:hypothetical protein